MKQPIDDAAGLKTAPILEYDADPRAVVMPDHEKLDLRLPERAVFAFLGDCIEEFAREQRLTVIGEFESITKRYPVYLYRAKGLEACLCQAPVGAPAATQIMDWLIAYGVKRIVSAGSCGALTALEEGAFILPRRALRDEGTSYHYLPAERHVTLNAAMQARIAATFRAQGIPFVECDTWTTDGFYRETAAKVASRREEGCGCVEMECAALAACAQFRGVEFGQFLYTADSLANLESYDERDWGHGSLRPSLDLCLRIIENV